MTTLLNNDRERFTTEVNGKIVTVWYDKKMGQFRYNIKTPGFYGKNSNESFACKLDAIEVASEAAAEGTIN